jgi:hypothetical protein
MFMRTQHEMVCAGIGLDPGSPLKYAVRLSHPLTIGTHTVYLWATSELAAVDVVGELYPEYALEGAELL